MSQTVLDGHIDPGGPDERPRVAETDVTVQEIVVQHALMGRSREAVTAELGITCAQLYAALTYYYENIEQIDETLRADNAYLRAPKYRRAEDAAGAPSPDRSSGAALGGGL